MIKLIDEKLKMEFGTGDIGFTGYYVEDGSIVGLVFYNQEPKKIGEIYDSNHCRKGSVDDYPVNMEFSKIESIDAVIKSLNRIKENMIKLQSK